MERLKEMGTWIEVEAPGGANILGCKWVFAIKTKPDGTIDRFKARLVVQGFGQIEGIDFDDTFATTAGRTTVRLFLAMVCAMSMHCHQMDVTTAFLYGDVDKPIYMRQPPGHDDGTGRVCKLLKSLYGLKQAPRIWSEKLRDTLLSFGFEVSKLDPSLYILKRMGKCCTFLILLMICSLLLTQWTWSIGPRASSSLSSR
jgi:hypothetical protein